MGLMEVDGFGWVFDWDSWGAFILCWDWVGYGWEDGLGLKRERQIGEEELGNKWELRKSSKPQNQN